MLEGTAAMTSKFLSQNLGIRQRAYAGTNDLDRLP
jgi:hypothetical protein